MNLPSLPVVVTRPSLAQLLTLNFHEHFELRPLLQDADDRLAAYHGNIAAGAVQQARSNLRNAAHRVIQRQIAKLWDDTVVTCTPAASVEFCSSTARILPPQQNCIVKKAAKAPPASAM